jgi:DNA-binding transcriptional regulator LsrR (DeoR family)
MDHAPSHAVSALNKLHRQLAADLALNKAEAKRLVKKMQHVEAVLKMLQPDLDLRPHGVARRRANPWFRRGVMSRHVLDVLRAADAPLTAAEIVGRMLDAKDVADPDPVAFRGLRNVVQSWLRRHAGAQVIAHQGRPQRWTLLG